MPDSNGYLAAVSRHDSNLEVFYNDASGNVICLTWLACKPGAWKSTVVPSSSGTKWGLTAVARMSTTVEVFWMDAQGNVMGSQWAENRSANKGWQPAPFWVASAVGSGNGIAGGLAAVSRNVYTVSLYWVAVNGAVMEAYQYQAGPEPNLVSGYNPVFDKVELAPAGSADAGTMRPDSGAPPSTTPKLIAFSRTASSEDVIWITPRGGVVHKQFNDGSGWSPLGTIYADQSGPTDDGSTRARAISASCCTPWTFNLAIVFGSGQLWDVYWVPASTPYNYNKDITQTGTCMYGVASTARMPVTAEVFCEPGVNFLTGSTPVPVTVYWEDRQPWKVTPLPNSPRPKSKNPNTAQCNA